MLRKTSLTSQPHWPATPFRICTHLAHDRVNAHRPPSFINLSPPALARHSQPARKLQPSHLPTPRCCPLLAPFPPFRLLPIGPTVARSA